MRCPVEFERGTSTRRSSQLLTAIPVKVDRELGVLDEVAESERFRKMKNLQNLLVLYWGMKNWT